MDQPPTFNPNLIGVAVLRIEIRDTACPSHVLQQWHWHLDTSQGLTGEWVDVPVVYESKPCTSSSSSPATTTGSPT